MDGKAAAVLHSVAQNHALVDGNKRLALAGLIPFHSLHGRRLTPTNDEAYDLVMTIAPGELDTVDDTAMVLQHATEPGRLTGKTSFVSLDRHWTSGSGRSRRWNLGPGQLPAAKHRVCRGRRGRWDKRDEQPADPM